MQVGGVSTTGGGLHHHARQHRLRRDAGPRHGDHGRQLLGPNDTLTLINAAGTILTGAAVLLVQLA